MKLEQAWHASSVGASDAPNEDLENLAGVWSSQLQVTISNPGVVQQGPVVQRLDAKTRREPMRSDSRMS